MITYKSAETIMKKEMKREADYLKRILQLKASILKHQNGACIVIVEKMRVDTVPGEVEEVIMKEVTVDLILRDIRRMRVQLVEDRAGVIEKVIMRIIPEGVGVIMSMGMRVVGVTKKRKEVEKMRSMIIMGLVQNKLEVMKCGGVSPKDPRQITFPFRKKKVLNMITLWIVNEAGKKILLMSKVKKVRNLLRNL
jgi:hypothetical protein